MDINFRLNYTLIFLTRKRKLPIKEKRKRDYRKIYDSIFNSFREQIRKIECIREYIRRGLKGWKPESLKIV